MSAWKRASAIAAGMVMSVLILSGCTVYSLVPPKPVTIGGAYTIDPQIAWSKRTAGNIEYWTVDGETLDLLVFFAEVKDGHSLFSGKTADDEDFPIYRAGMRATDIQDLVVASYRKSGFEKVEPHNLRPAPFGSLQGFRFDLDFVDANGLERRGTVLGAASDAGLNLILFDGPRQHYFPKYEEAVERLMASVRGV